MREDEELAILYRKNINEAVKERAHEMYRLSCMMDGMNTDKKTKRRSFSLSQDKNNFDGFENAAITPAMLVEARRDFFDEMDVDGSGDINYKELRVGLSGLMTKSRHGDFHGKRFKRLCRLIDPDQSGSISRDEFSSFLGDANQFAWQNEKDEEIKNLKEEIEELKKLLPPITENEEARDEGDDPSEKQPASEDSNSEDDVGQINDAGAKDDA